MRSTWRAIKPLASGKRCGGHYRLGKSTAVRRCRSRSHGRGKLSSFWPRNGEALSIDALLTATALMFVAFTGYGRIATMGEEVRGDHGSSVHQRSGGRNRHEGQLNLARGDHHRSSSSRHRRGKLHLSLYSTSVGPGRDHRDARRIVEPAAGLWRMLLAMVRRGDMPEVLSRVNQTQTTPTRELSACLSDCWS